MGRNMILVHFMFVLFRGYIAPQKGWASKPATAGFIRELIFRRVWLLARSREGLNQSSGTRLTLMIRFVYF